MRAAVVFTFLCLTSAALAGSRRGKGSAAAATTTTAAATTTTTTTTTTTAATDAEEAYQEDDKYTLAAKSLIDSGSCDTVTANNNCGSAATSYFTTFEYNSMLVVVSSGVPDHEAENDAVNANPNTRCEVWQFMSVPLANSPSQAALDTGLGTTGLAVTGGHFYNHLSSPLGDIALYNEGKSLDSCFGHSDASGIYHYHANINCTNSGAAAGANDAEECILVGYMKDGIPIYGLCKDGAGAQFTSCYHLVDGADTEELTLADGGTYTVASMDTDYEFDSSTTGCNLDLANGAVHPVTGQYSYFMTTGYPWLPTYYYGAGGAASLCSLGY